MSALASIGLGLAKQFIGPAVSNVLDGSRLQGGYNGPAISRYLQYWANFLSCAPNSMAYTQSLGGFDLLGDNYQPMRMSGDQLITRFNQFDWSRVDGDQAASDRVWRWLQGRMRWNGIDMAVPLQEGASGVPVPGTTKEQLEWYRLVEMQCSSVPLASVIRDYWRGRVRNPDAPQVTDAELKYNISRAQFRRKADRDRVMNPFYPWSPSDALKLRWLGVIDNEEYTSLLNAGGIVRSRDATIFDAVSRRTPEPDGLLRWAMRGIWNDDLAGRYGLDDGFESSPVANFFAKAGGVGVDQPPLPGQPEGNANWAALTYRAQRPLPGFEPALQMQYRLRPSANDPAMSVVPGVATWGDANTRDMLRLEGFSETIINSLMGLADQPINIRIINEVLLEAVKHPNVAADAQAAFGDGVDWVKGAFLDHGFSDRTAQLAGDAIRAKADDQVHAEKLESQRELRKARRDVFLKRYAVGTINLADLRDAVAEDQFDRVMVAQAAGVIDLESDLAVTESHLAAIKEGYLSGKLSLDQVSAQMTALNLTDARKINYIQEWTWKRGDNQRMLSTGEILAAVKRGIMTPAVALTRLVNLGWTQPDALVEIAQVEQELAQASAHATSAAQAKAIAARLKAEREEASAARAAALASKRAATSAAKLASETADAPHEIAAAQASYDAAALLDRDAYTKAIGKGDADKAQAEIDKAIAAYQKLLKEQLALARESPEIAHEIPRPAEVPIPQTGEGQGVSAATANASSPASGPANASGGAGAPPGPG
jgi:hypothetical protein